MTHHWNAGIYDGTNRLCPFAASLQFDGVHSRLLEKAPGIPNRLIIGNLVRHERHITHQQGIFCATCHRLAVVEHIIHGHRDCTLVTQLHHAEAVAHQDNFNPHLVQHQGSWIIIRGEHADWLMAQFHRLHEAGGDFLTFVLITIGKWCF